MMWTEFKDAIGCKDTEHNRMVFDVLESGYMNTDVDKYTIYEWGKKLVDNSLTESEKEWKHRWEGEIADIRWQIEQMEKDASMYKEWMMTETDVVHKMVWRTRRMTLKDDIKRGKSRIRFLKGMIKDLEV